MTSYALYRLPYADYCFRVEQTDGEPLQLSSLDALNECTGFVVAPFQTTAETPVLLIRPDQVEKLAVQLPAGKGRRGESVSPADNNYRHCFEQISHLLQEDTFRKVVLARNAVLVNQHDVSPEELFWRACQCYPRLFIALVAMPDGSYWLTATPEILLEGIGSQWRTIALAGTMQLEGEDLKSEGERVRWSTKNIQEQRYVATYIANCLEQFSLRYKEEGPRTVRAAHLVHLRSDFTFTLPPQAHVGDLLAQLHPTPAVCGLPKQETFDFIVRNEHADRQYYSGFMGPLAMNGETHLYVSLRCMHIEDAVYHLYAGGGILKDSQLEQEWQETESKMLTMRNLL